MRTVLSLTVLLVALVILAMLMGWFGTILSAPISAIEQSTRSVDTEQIAEGFRILFGLIR
jgi:cell division septal protein FtsQ